MSAAGIVCSTSADAAAAAAEETVAHAPMADARMADDAQQKAIAHDRVAERRLHHADADPVSDPPQFHSNPRERQLSTPERLRRSRHLSSFAIEPGCQAEISGRRLRSHVTQKR